MTYVIQRYMGNGWVTITKPNKLSVLTKRLSRLSVFNAYRIVKE